MCKILIVEDEEDLINIIGTVLTDEGYSVRKASSAEEALLACQSVPPDLIISDVRMGVLSGFDLLERIKTNGFLKNTPFVFLTSLDEVQARIKALGLGAAAYITKPFDLDDLFETIRKFAPL